MTPQSQPTNPKVSVVIPTYNRAETVQKGIDSVLAQTFADLEIIVVDDGSSDNTGETLKQAYGDRIRYYYQINQGVSAARNKGISESRGEWIAFLDSDDVWEKEKLELQLRTLDQFGPSCTACYTDTQLFNHMETRTLFQMAEHIHHEGTAGVNRKILELLIRPGGAGMIVCISSLMARAEEIRKLGGFDCDLGFYADSEFMFRLALNGGFCYVNRRLVWFDRSPSETRHVGASKQWDNLEFILRESRIRLEKFLGLSDRLPREIRGLIREHLASVNSGLANCHLERREYGKARAAALTALRMDPGFNVAIKWLLACASPRLALRVVRRYQEQKSSATTV